MRSILTLGILILILCSCDHKKNHKHTTNKHMHEHEHKHDHGHDDNAANKHMHSNDFETLVERFEDPERATWQQPDMVVEMLGDLSGKKVMDLGSGTGYFSFRLADAGAHVIAADVDTQFLSYISDRIAKGESSLDQIETRQVPYDAPGLELSEADLFFTVNTYHHIENRVSYMKQVYAGLKDDGKVVIVDFKKEETDHGPPEQMRLGVKDVGNELIEAGFTIQSTDSESLSEQYIITAVK